MSSTLARIKTLESDIDKTTSLHPIFQHDFLKAACAVLELREYARFKFRSPWDGSIEVLIPLLLKHCAGKRFQIDPITSLDALRYFDGYYYLRELFYYTYNFPQSIGWSFYDHNQIDITFRDDSIPLQLWYDHNSWFARSHRVFQNYKRSEQTYKVVLGIEEEFKDSKGIDEAYKGCLEEARLKLGTYRNFLDDNLCFKTYTVDQFRQIYLHVTARALLRRYFVRKYLERGDEDHVTCLTLTEKDFEEALSEATGIDRTIVDSILKDITFDKEKASFRFDFDSFPLLFDERKSEFLMFPHAIAFSNCFESVRRLWAKENPQRYGQLVAPMVDRIFTKLIEDSFSSSGFHNVEHRVNVADILPKSPDIDLLVVTVEPGDMHVVLICELKNPLPELSAKDFVASASKDGSLFKAKIQLERLKELPFLQFRELIKRSFPNIQLGYGAYAMCYMTITSKNIGVLIQEGDQRVIDYEMLQSVLHAANGDIVLFLRYTDRKRLVQMAKKCYSTYYTKWRFGEYMVTFPEIAIRNIMNFV